MKNKELNQEQSGKSLEKKVRSKKLQSALRKNLLRRKERNSGQLPQAKPEVYS